MSGMAIVGDMESILPYRAFGFEAFPASPGDCDRVMHRLMSDAGYRVIFILEEHAEACRELLAEMRASERAFPLVVEIPGIRGAGGGGHEKMKRIVERAVGADILSRED